MQPLQYFVLHLRFGHTPSQVFNPLGLSPNCKSPLPFRGGDFCCPNMWAHTTYTHTRPRINTRLHTTRWTQVGTHAKHVGLHIVHVAPRRTLSWAVVAVRGTWWTGVDFQCVKVADFWGSTRSRNGCAQYTRGFPPTNLGVHEMRVDALPVRMDTQQQHVAIQRITMGVQP